MDIMTTLFSQDYVTARYGDEREKIGERRGERRGEIRGERRGKEATALRLLQKGMSVQFITEVTGLSAADIQALQKEQKV